MVRPKIVSGATGESRQPLATYCSSFSSSFSTWHPEWASSTPASRCRSRWIELTWDFFPSAQMRLEPSGERWEHVTPGELCCQWVPEGKSMADWESASKRIWCSFWSPERFQGSWTGGLQPAGPRDWPNAILFKVLSWWQFKAFSSPSCMHLLILFC